MPWHDEFKLGQADSWDRTARMWMFVHDLNKLWPSLSDSWLLITEQGGAPMPTWKEPPDYLFKGGLRLIIDTITKTNYQWSKIYKFYMMSESFYFCFRMMLFFSKMNDEGKFPETSERKENYWPAEVLKGMLMVWIICCLYAHQAMLLWGCHLFIHIYPSMIQYDVHAKPF